MKRTPVKFKTHRPIATLQLLDKFAEIQALCNDVATMVAQIKIGIRRNSLSQEQIVQNLTEIEKALKT